MDVTQNGCHLLVQVFLLQCKGLQQLIPLRVCVGVSSRGEITSPDVEASQGVLHPRRGVVGPVK